MYALLANREQSYHRIVTMIASDAEIERGNSPPLLRCSGRWAIRRG